VSSGVPLNSGLSSPRMGVSQGLRRFSRAPLFDTFLLAGAERKVASYPQGRRDKMKELFAAAELRRRATGELFEGPAASLALFREAALLYMAAFVAVAPDGELREPLRPAEVLAQFEKLDKELACPCSKNDLDAFFELLVEADPLALDRLAPSEASERARSIPVIVTWLRDLNEPRTVGQIRRQRYARIASFSFILLGTLGWGVNALVAPKNIALQKPVTMSSMYPGVTSNPLGLTDGITSGAYAVHTNKEEKPWVQVDLGEVYRIDKVKVYNRGDGWFDEGLPMTLELSENGVDFTEAETRTKSFGQWIPWTAKVGKKKGRFVRVRGNRGAYVTLSEIEVFGNK
jgi:hypothetical protein